MRVWVLAAVVIIAVIIASGCSNAPEGDVHGTEGDTTYEYYNVSDQNRTELPGGLDLGFVFKLNYNEMITRPNGSFSVPIIFNNVEDDQGSHLFVARMFPAEVDFDVKAAYQCEYFGSCPELSSDMNFWISQNRSQVNVSYGFVGLREIYFDIPEDAAKGTYLFKAVACRDVPFEECDESTSNFGPSQTFSVKII